MYAVKKAKEGPKFLDYPRSERGQKILEMAAQRTKGEPRYTAMEISQVARCRVQEVYRVIAKYGKKGKKNAGTSGKRN